MRVFLKERKQKKSGKISLYLEIYKGTKVNGVGKIVPNREYKYLDLFITPNPKTLIEKNSNKRILNLANTIRHKTDMEIAYKKRDMFHVTFNPNGKKLTEAKKPELNSITSITNAVNKFKTKHKQGFVYSEIESLLKEYGINRTKFDEAMGCVTCIVKEPIYYKHDIASAIRTVISGKENSLDWD